MVASDWSVPVSLSLYECITITITVSVYDLFIFLGKKKRRQNSLLTTIILCVYVGIVGDIVANDCCCVNILNLHKFTIYWLHENG